MTHQTLALIAVLGLAAASLAAAQGNTVFEDWSKQAVGKTGIPDGWQGQNWAARSTTSSSRPTVRRKCST